MLCIVRLAPLRWKRQEVSKWPLPVPVTWPSTSSCLNNLETAAPRCLINSLNNMLSDRSLVRWWLFPSMMRWPLPKGDKFLFSLLVLVLLLPLLFLASSCVPTPLYIGHFPLYIGGQVVNTCNWSSGETMSLFLSLSLSLSLSCTKCWRLDPRLSLTPPTSPHPHTATRLNLSAINIASHLSSIPNFSFFPFHTQPPHVNNNNNNSNSNSNSNSNNNNSSNKTNE